MDLGIAGRDAIICASSKGLGRACAMELARAGCRVVVNGAAVTVIPGDVGDPRVRDALLAACPEPDILVNNNGGPPPAEFEKLTREQILAGLEANMLTPIDLVQRVAPGMASRKFGRIINITSASVRTPIARLDVSSGARAGLTAFLASAARRYAKDNVTINSIQPGVFDTDRIRVTLGARSAAVPAARLGTPEEFGALCAFLASAQAGYIVGQNILTDGGAFPGSF
jgi:3-oxoacyl-[acyl-carrier protein] reductase